MTNQQSPLSQVHLVMDAYLSRHSSYFYNLKEHRSVISLSKKILNTHLFKWEINPFDPGERDTFEHGCVNSQYELTIHGTEFEHKYLNLMRNGFRYYDDFQLLCQDNVQYQPSYIPWSLEERIQKLLDYNEYLKFGIDFQNDVILNEIIEVFTASNYEQSYLEQLLDESSLFERNTEESEALGNSVWVYSPGKLLGIKFVLKCIDLNNRIPDGIIVLRVDDDSIEYVDIHCDTESRSNSFFHLWSCISKNFAQNVADFIDYGHRIPRFATFVERIFNCLCPKAINSTNIVEAALREAYIKHPNEKADTMVKRIMDFVCLNRINPVLEIVSPPELEIRLGRSVRLQVRSYPEMGSRDLKLYCRTSREQIVNVQITEGYAEINALAVGDVELYFFDGISDRNFHSIAVRVVNPTYCSQIVVRPGSVIMPTHSTAEVSLFYEPKEALDAESLVWTSDDSSVAKANGSCQIHSGQPGIAHITVQGEDVKTQLRVIVKPRIQSIQTDKSLYGAYVNQIIPVSITTLPSDCYDNSIDVRIQDTAVLSINSQGKFVARSQGITTVTLYSKAEPMISSSFEVKVEFMPEPKTPAIKHFFSLLLLWLLLCWAAYLPLLIFAGQLYFASRAVSENKGNTLKVAVILILQLFFQLFIL